MYNTPALFSPSEEYEIYRVIFLTGHTSSDTVGDERRGLLAEIMERNQPFDLTRPCVTDWEVKSLGSPFANLSAKTMSDFISSTRDKFMLLYPDV